MPKIIVSAVALLALGALLLGCSMTEADNPRLTTVEDAVNAQNIAAVERLARSGATLEQRDAVGATPLITACSTGQFRIAEVLVHAGADVFAVDQFGVTAGRMADVSRISDRSAEGEARRRVLAEMARRGFPFPAPEKAAVQAMVAGGRWPPRH